MPIRECGQWRTSKYIKNKEREFAPEAAADCCPDQHHQKDFFVWQHTDTGKFA